MKKKSILIIEDNKNLAFTLQMALKTAGYKTDISFDGEEGYKKILEETPDLLFLDILLPNLFGLEILERIRRNKNRKVAALPVIVATNYPEAEYYKKAAELNAAGFITKADYSLADIVRLIREII